MKLTTKCQIFPKLHCTSMECGWSGDMRGESFGCARMNRIVAKVIIMLFAVCGLAAIAYFAS